VSCHLRTSTCEWLAEPTCSSVATACFGLIKAVATVSIEVTAFVRDVRDARSETDSVAHELLSLKTVLELLADDASESSATPIPTGLAKQICGIMSNCNEVVTEIEKCLKQHEGSRIQKGIRWTTQGRGDMAKLRLSLEAHKSALEIALDMVAMYVSLNVGKNLGDAED
jgi:hypothetical protein